jgi:Putative Actinobacterial Holin-X, holin superfamily III
MTARPCCRKVRCMARDDPRDASLIGAAGDLLTAFSDLVRKELRLAHAEVSQKLNQCLRAGIWMAAAVILGLLAALLVAEAAVFALASAGLALHWSCLLVAAILAALAATAFYASQVRMSGDLSPARTVRQFNEAVRSATEQLR